jgi:hypothetical protein
VSRRTIKSGEGTNDLDDALSGLIAPRYRFLGRGAHRFKVLIDG